METESTEERIKLFLELVEDSPNSKETLDGIYPIVMKFDTPPYSNRSFIYDCLIAYYCSIEEYEKCALLLKQKKKNKVKKITARGVTRAELTDLRLLGFEVPEEVKRKVLEKSLTNRRRHNY